MALLELFQTANLYTDNLFGIMLVFSLYCVVFLSIMLNQREMTSAFITAGIITAMASIFLRIAGTPPIISDHTFFVTIAGCAIPIGFALFMSKN